MKPTLYAIQSVGPGRLSIMARPRGGDWLADEMAAARADGVDVIVSALQSAEEAEFDLVGERDAAIGAGMEFVSLPIPDMGVPEATSDVMDVLRHLDRALANRNHVAVHCRMSIGRSSLIAASLLRLQGMSADEAFERVEKPRSSRSGNDRPALLGVQPPSGRVGEASAARDPAPPSPEAGGGITVAENMMWARRAVLVATVGGTTLLLLLLFLHPPREGCEHLGSPAPCPIDRNTQVFLVGVIVVVIGGALIAVIASRRRISRSSR